MNAKMTPIPKFALEFHNLVAEKMAIAGIAPFLDGCRLLDSEVLGDSTVFYFLGKAPENGVITKRYPGAKVHAVESGRRFLLPRTKRRTH